MKQIAKFITVAIVMIAFAANSFGQGVTATANASATIITPLTITKTVDLNFGNISVGAVTGGTVSLSTANVRNATGTCSFQLAPASTVATFDITGATGANLLVTLPASSTISNGAVTMTIDNYAHDAPGTIVGGALTFHVGGTLNVNNGQAAGAYTGTFDVTINYN
jgi:hypothetical protein